MAWSCDTNAVRRLLARDIVVDVEDLTPEEVVQEILRQLS